MFVLSSQLNAILRCGSVRSAHLLSNLTRSASRTGQRRGAAHSHRTSYAMDKVYLRNPTDTEELHLSFRYSNAALKVDREFNFCRKMNEKVDDALVRIRNNIEKELNKRAKKGKKKSPAEVPPPLAIAGVPLEEILVEFQRVDSGDKVTELTFSEMLAQSADGLQLRVLDDTFEVVVNQPWVINLVLPTTILAGFTVYPSKVELQFAERRHCRAAWYKAEMPASRDLQKGASWTHCGDGFFYTTSNDDVGSHLKFVLTPGNSVGIHGPPVENICKNAVSAGPGPCPFETRHCFTSERLTGAAFRVVSYNLLADLYADSDYSRTHLFPYCPPYALKMDYRKQLFLKELLGYRADIVCLQEVDMKIFDLDLKPVLESPEHSYAGIIAQKGTSGEGVATFYRQDRYELVESHELNIGAHIRTLPVFAALWRQIAANEKLVERICDRATTLQVVLLKCKDNDRYVLVANTHLYFHPDADHIRLLQIGFSALHVEQLYRQALARLQLADEQQLAIVFCGDFNSVPECGIYKLMTEGFVDADFIDWSSNAEEAVKGVTLSQPFSMDSACGTPPYTNYTVGFAACLDYIFYQRDRLEVQQVVPLPTEEELQAHTAIPSVVFPSDHVALVADLKFKEL